jgi:hypothetical protein
VPVFLRISLSDSSLLFSFEDQFFEILDTRWRNPVSALGYHVSGLVRLEETGRLENTGLIKQLILPEAEFLED